MSASAPEISYIDHIEELRRRLLVAVAALAAATFLSFAFADKLITLLAVPIGGTQNLQAIQVTENFSVFMRVSLVSGVILASPIILYEIFAFILPGLHQNEIKFVRVGVPVATLLFLGGVAFAYLVMLPNALPVLTNFLDIPNKPRPLDYFNFVTGLIFWLGVSFETPIVIFLLAKLKVVTPRFLVKNWRYAVVIIAILAGLITPTTDPVNMILLMAPLILLYWISVLLAFVAVRKS